MACIPTNVAESFFSFQLQQAGLSRIHQGKVADTYLLDNGLRLVVRTDRMSIFDFVLPCLVPGKGAVLTEMTVFWLRNVLPDYPNHLVAAGEAIDQYLPRELRGNDYLRTHGMVVKTLQMIPVECIVRGNLTGSGWDAYCANQGVVCGVQLPPGLQNGSRLTTPTFTPTTKATKGHDVHLKAEEVAEQYGSWIRLISVDLYTRAAAYAAARGIILADTKMEFGKCEQLGDEVLGDEVFTPDSSRYWDAAQWELALAQHTLPPSLDKQFLREWGKTVEHPFRGLKPGINNLDPENLAHVAFVSSLQVPPEVIGETARIYREICTRLTAA